MRAVARPPSQAATAHPSLRRRPRGGGDTVAVPDTPHRLRAAPRPFSIGTPTTNRSADQGERDRCGISPRWGTTAEPRGGPVLGAAS